jgi:hypothetical protein
MENKKLSGLGKVIGAITLTCAGAYSLYWGNQIDYNAIPKKILANQTYLGDKQRVEANEFLYTFEGKKLRVDQTPSEGMKSGEKYNLFEYPTNIPLFGPRNVAVRNYEENNVKEYAPKVSAPNYEKNKTAPQKSTPLNPKKFKPLRKHTHQVNLSK